MKTIPRDDIEIALKKKGFEVAESRDHRFWYFFYQGKKTIVRTKISRGSKFKDYRINLLKSVKEDLYFDNLNDLRDFVDCPIEKEDYEEILKKKGIIETSN